jgi:RHS repeat-associated protein
MWDYPITAPQPYTYNGKEFIDYGFDVYDYGFRGYYAATGRFTSIDPMCEKTYAISPYAYASNNPVNNIDFMGLWTCGTATQTSGNFSMSNDIYVGVDISEFVENEDVLVGNSDLSLYDLFTSGLFGGGGRRYFNHYEKYRRFYFY